MRRDLDLYFREQAEVFLWVIPRPERFFGERAFNCKVPIILNDFHMMSDLQNLLILLSKTKVLKNPPLKSVYLCEPF